MMPLLPRVFSVALIPIRIDAGVPSLNVPSLFHSRVLLVTKFFCCGRCHVAGFCIPCPQLLRGHAYFPLSSSHSRGVGTSESIGQCCLLTCPNLFSCVEFRNR